MEFLKDFKTRLKEIFAENGISASEVARLLGIRNRTSLFRILNGEASHKKQKEFLTKLREANLKKLEHVDWQDLEESLEVTRVGKEDFLANQAMNDMVMMPTQHDKDIRVASFRDDGESTLTHISEVVDQMFQGCSIHLMIVGCCDIRLFRAIDRQLHKDNLPQQIKITHYIEAVGAELIHSIAAIQPVVYQDCYTGFMLPASTLANEVRVLYHGNVILADYEDADGHQHFQEFIMTDYGYVRSYAHQYAGLHSFLLDTLNEHEEILVPIKASLAQSSGTGPEDYVGYTQQYYLLENDSNLYDIKRDVPINYIHPDILLNPVIDGFAQNDFGDAQGREQLIQIFYDIQLNRWNNFFMKHKATHTIFTYEAMRQFALTGFQSDHFYAMRAYTPQERKEILTFLRGQLIENPYFNFYFFKEGYQPVSNEIGIYEGKGVLMTKAFTDYKLDGEHAEVLITQPEFCARFKNYFLQELLVHKVTSTKETLALMDTLIELCEA